MEHFVFHGELPILSAMLWRVRNSRRLMLTGEPPSLQR
jgi:hypothetical protein